MVIAAQSAMPLSNLVTSGETVGFYHPWWSEPVVITSDSDFVELGYATPDTSANLQMPTTSAEALEANSDKAAGTLDLKFNDNIYHAPVSAADFSLEPTLLQRFLHVFGWSAS